MKYTSEQCGICHGDISMSNLGIFRVWDDDDSNNDATEKDIDDPDLDALAKPSDSDSDGDSEGESEGESEGASEGESEGNGNNSDGEGDGEGDSEGEGQSEGDGEGQSKGDGEGVDNNNLDWEAWDNASVAADIDARGPLTTLTVGPSNMTESDLTSLSTSTATIQPRDKRPPLTTTSSIIRAYGIVIDFDNSFSITDAQKHKYKITSVRHPMLFILLHLILD